MYRTHETPDSEKIRKLSTFINNFGYNIHLGGDEIHPKELQKLLEKIDGTDESLTVYTTRPDTIYGVTYMVIAPEHPIVAKLIEGTENEAECKEFIHKMQFLNEIERTSSEAEKEGVFTGRYMVNPITGDKIPLYLAK